jgi:hypothetical protein
MKTKVRNPNIQILLHKIVTRTQIQGTAPQAQATTGSGAPFGFSSPSAASAPSASLVGPPSQSDSPSNIYDLTAWLGEGSVVRVQKSVRGDGGVFSIDFVDQLMGGLHDSLSALIEPSDMFEIRFAGDAYKYAGANGQQLPIMMRGFVSRVTRSQSMSADGKPRRTVHVEGHDYHKILQIMQIFNMPCTPESANLLASYPFFSKFTQFGADSNIQNSTDFVNAVFNLLVNPYIAGMQGAGATSGTSLLPITTDIQVPDALVSVQLGAFNSGNVQELLQEYLDLHPFNEFFIEDRDAGAWGSAGPYAVYRPAPLLGAGSRSPLQPIQASVTTGVTTDSPLSPPSANVVQIDTSSIISITGDRSDDGLANFYWVDAPRFNMNYQDLTKMYASYATQQGAVPYYLTNYENVNPALYGLRKMEVATQQGGSTETNNGNGQPADDTRWDNQNAFLGWIDDRRNLLIALNKDNVIFESGDMRLMGNEKIRAGVYVQINYGPQLQSLHYAHTVTHIFEPFGSYLCEVEYDRGTNFIDRWTADKAGASPYYVEMVQPGS